MQKETAELVYWEQNNEKRVEKEKWKEILKVIKKGRIIEEWKENVMPYGYMKCMKIRSKGRTYIVKEWVPAYGYSWNEVEVYRLIHV
ncbi:MAG: hypothetical protein QXU69_10850 [Thermofilaceae archaeon]